MYLQSHNESLIQTPCCFGAVNLGFRNPWGQFQQENNSWKDAKCPAEKMMKTTDLLCFLHLWSCGRIIDFKVAGYFKLMHISNTTYICRNLKRSESEGVSIRSCHKVAVNIYWHGEALHFYPLHIWAPVGTSLNLSAVWRGFQASCSVWPMLGSFWSIFAMSSLCCSLNSLLLWHEGSISEELGFRSDCAIVGLNLSVISERKVYFLSVLGHDFIYNIFQPVLDEDHIGDFEYAD